MTDYIDELYPIALDCGVDQECFWTLSLAEIHDRLESYERTEKRKMKQRLTEKHYLARDIAQHVSLILNGSEDVQIMELWDFFPELFAEEGPLAEKKKQEMELAAYKAQMIDFTLRHNHSRERGDKAGRHDA